MGTSNSTLGESDLDRDKILKRAGPQLGLDEGQAIKKLFVAIAGGPDKRVYEESNVHEYCRRADINLPTPSVTGIFNALLGEDRDKYKQYSGNDNPQQSFFFFVKHICHILKGGLQDQAERIYIFCSRDSVPLRKSSLDSSLADLIKVVCESRYVKNVFPHVAKFSQDLESNQRLSLFLTEPLIGSQKSADDFEIPQDSFEDWLSKSALAQKIFQLAFLSIFYQEALCSEEAAGSSVVTEFQEHVKTSPHLLHVPVKLCHPLIREVFSSKLLDHASLMLINNFIPTDFRGKIYPLFSSFHHGESFSMFCKQLVAARGPTLVVVKDTDGNVFGGFAADMWQFGPKFRGNANCFLFTLAPTMGVYLPSGYNENYMYLEQNAQTLPNGLGMGGQMDYFGLWLSADYGHGHSKARPKCSTYNSPRLSKEEEFKVQLLEVWGVGEPVLPDSEETDTGPSILDKDKTAASLLEMAGKKLYSKDVREAPDES